MLCLIARFVVSFNIIVCLDGHSICFTYAYTIIIVFICNGGGGGGGGICNCFSSMLDAMSPIHLGNQDPRCKGARSLYQV